MACYNPDSASDKIGELTNELLNREAMLCAILTELENRGIADEVIQDASQKGAVGIMDFWDNHKTEDQQRVIDGFKATFSKHEQELLLKLIQEGKI